ncbi:MAG: CvpA family protein [Chitinophagaceae bacterium]|nr:MAG: CvpA family protein [Chitinophagaceae bacterium]
MLVDIILLGLMIMAVVKGLQRGFIVALFSMIAFIVGLVAALKLSTVVAAYLDDSINVSSRWLPFLAFALVFLVVVLLVRLLAAVIQSTIELAMLGWVNRVAGIFLYAVMYILIFSVLLFFAVQMHFFDEATLEASATYPYIKPVGPFVIDGIGTLLPWFKDMFAELQGFFDRLSEKVPQPNNRIG